MSTISTKSHQQIFPANFADTGELLAPHILLGSVSARLLTAASHFITRQDCRNACRKIHDFSNHRHINDAVSVDRIVQELQSEDPSPVIAYKPQGVLKEEYSLLRESNFLLVLMTPFQADLFRNFGSIGCVDSTHKTNEYGYKLITLVVADEYHNGLLNSYVSIVVICILSGLPVAWGIADTKDINTYTGFFSAIKKRVPDAVISVLMTDDGQ